MNFSKMSTFQTVLLAVLGFAAFAGLITFSLFRPTSTSVTKLVIWGTLPATQVNEMLSRPEIVTALESQKLALTYSQKSDDTIDSELLHAMAIDQGPDAVILAQDQIHSYADRITPVPYSVMSVRTFQDTFIQEGQLFLEPDGIAAIPFMIDPMVMYWNKDLLTSANIASAPRYWPDVVSMIPRITKSDVNGTISRATVALGTYDNISHAKDIISLLLLQAGAPIVGLNRVNNAYTAQVSTVPGLNTNPGDSAISFYTQFADPSKNVYSWNGALQLSRDYFTAGRLALYFGYASENKDIYDRNPNLHYDVATVPQIDSNQTKITFGKMYGIAILKSTRNVNTTFTAINTLSGPASQYLWSSVTGLPPVVTALYGQTPTDPDQAVFYTAALQSRAWLDPNRDGTSNIFSNMIRAITSGASRSIDAVRTAESQINQYLQ